MKWFNEILSRLASYLGRHIQGENEEKGYSDISLKGTSISVVSIICSALTNLITLYFTLPIVGDSERAVWLDSIATKFVDTQLDVAFDTTFSSGDLAVVPLWDGRSIKNIMVDRNNFAVIEDGIIYKVATQTYDRVEYDLMQAITMEPYTAADGNEYFNNTYRLFVFSNGDRVNVSLDKFPAWADYDSEFVIPAVDRPLFARFKSLAINPNNLNAVMGVPITFGASQPIQEIRYLLNQWHTEFDLSEKMIFADKTMFIDNESRGKRLPSGDKRVVQKVRGSANVGENGLMHDWSPEIRMEYEAALDYQVRLVEQCVGVSNGVISQKSVENYTNVDRVRKSTVATQGMIDKYRKAAESFFDDLVYIWDTLANFYGITTPGEYEIKPDWSDEYITTFSDKMNAILSGEAIGATDATDYRTFLYDEPPEVAAEKVAQISGNNTVTAFETE